HDLSPEDWARPTDLPGWDVRAIACHLAHLESELAGNAQEPVEVPELEHVASPMGRYTEQGPLARAGWSTDAVVDELEQASAARAKALREDPPTDPKAVPEVTPGGIGWSWETLLSNRPLDVWMHEQDVRRAVDRPGNLDSPAGAHTVGVFARGFGFVVGKRVAPPAGTVVALEVTGPHPVRTAVRMGEDGRAGAVDPDSVSPDATLRLGVEPYLLLAGGRRRPSDVPVEIEGDEELARRVLAALAVTP
ncbi:MAG: maleylpyruvate isomerase family mycothiol-dependent enzyme, partial [Nocardioidaceae bacterium]